MRDAIQEIMEYNDPKYNYVKLAEELAELSEVVIKRFTKRKENMPSVEKLIEEVGDVLFRLKVISRQEGIALQVNERIAQKSTKLLKYLDEGKYKGTI